MIDITASGHTGIFNNAISDPTNQVAGTNYFGVYCDFAGCDVTTTTPSYTNPNWTTTLVGSSLAVLEAADLGFGGIGKFTCPASASSAQQFQWIQEIFKAFGPSSTQYPAKGGLDLHAEIRFSLDDVTNMDMGFGFAKTGTTQIATPPSDVIGLRKVNKATFSLDVIKGSAAYAGSDATSFVQVPNTQYHTLYIRVTPYNDLSTGAMHVCFDGQEVGRWTRKDGNAVTLPTVSLAPYFGFLSHDSASHIARVDYAAWAQRRYV